MDLEGVYVYGCVCVFARACSGRGGRGWFWRYICRQRVGEGTGGYEAVCACVHVCWGKGLEDVRVCERACACVGLRMRGGGDTLEP